jgi:CsoR family transcriptional regulator, copper-sensing transcriptional repressor
MILSDSSTNKSLPSNPHHHHHDDDSVHPHHHDEESMRRLVNRLSRIEGHVRGIKTMVQENRPCPEVLVQVAAVRGALDRVARIILDEHLTQCIGRAAKEGNIDTEIEELKAALDRFLP